MYTLLKAGIAMLVLEAIAIVLVSTPSPRPSRPTRLTRPTPIDYSGQNVYRLDWTTIHPGAIYYSSGAVTGPGFVLVGNLSDVLRWVESMPSGTILLCSEYQAATHRVFAPGQFLYFLRVSRRRGIRVIVDEWRLPPSIQVVRLHGVPQY